MKKKYLMIGLMMGLLVSCGDDSNGNPAGPGSQTPVVCADGIDNEPDGLIDAADATCQANPTDPTCGDLADNEANGALDLADPHCAAYIPTEVCGDGADNDGDGLVDEDCAAPQPGAEVCGDGIDNNGDGLVDENCTPQPVAEVCGDGIDNNGDGQVDENCTVTPAPVSWYPHGVGPANINAAAIQQWYNEWIARYFIVHPSGTMARIQWDPHTYGGVEYSNLTVSEGVAYGMIITGFMGDMARFDQLLAYYEANISPKGLMSWLLNEWSGPLPESVKSGAIGGATDADLDAMTMLIHLGTKWSRPDYHEKARTYISKYKSAIRGWKSEALCVGDYWCTKFNPSYVSFVAFRKFKELTGDTWWDSVLEDSYKLMEGNQNPTTGLWSDWCNYDGTLSGISIVEQKYALEAIRVPWRMAWDYAWYGQDRTKNLMDNFMRNMIARAPTPGDTRGEYIYSDGTGLKELAPATLGGICAGATVSAEYQGWLDACYPMTLAKKDQFGSYYQTIVQLMSLLLLSGQYQ